MSVTTVGTPADPADSQAAVTKRRVGRPRNTGTPDESPRDQILRAATRLFTDKGYAQTTMTDIARAAGLAQSSLYYWFSRKEQILQAALVLNRAPLEFVGRIGASSGNPALKLYRLLRFDTYQLCIAASDFNEVERMAEAQPDAFADFWRDYQQLHGWAAIFIRAAIEEGLFIECDPEETATTLLCLNEGVQKRFRNQPKHLPGGGSPFTHHPLTAERFAQLVASTSVRSLLAQTSLLEQLEADASEFNDFDLAREASAPDR
jgi:AcrR family transcriptional regulator